MFVVVFRCNTFDSGAPQSMSITGFTKSPGATEPRFAILTTAYKSMIIVRIPHTVCVVRWGCVIELENKPLFRNLVDRIFQFIRQPCNRKWRPKKRKEKTQAQEARSGVRDQSILYRIRLAAFSAFLCQIQSGGHFDRFKAASPDAETYAAVEWANVYQQRRPAKV